MKNTEDNLKALHLLTLTLTAHNRGELSTPQARMVLREAGFPPHIVFMVATAGEVPPVPKMEPRVVSVDAGTRKDLSAFLRANRRRWNLRFAGSNAAGRKDGYTRCYEAHCHHAPFIARDAAANKTRVTRLLSWFISPF